MLWGASFPALSSSDLQLYHHHVFLCWPKCCFSSKVLHTWLPVYPVRLCFFHNHRSVGSRGRGAALEARAAGWLYILRYQKHHTREQCVLEWALRKWAVCKGTIPVLCQLAHQFRPFEFLRLSLCAYIRCLTLCYCGNALHPKLVPSFGGNLLNFQFLLLAFYSLNLPSLVWNACFPAGVTI